MQEVSWLEKLVASLCGQLYYPVEHLAWAADHQLVSVNSIPIWTLAVVLWGIPLLFTLLRKLFILYKQLRTHASPSSSTSTTVRVTSLKHQTLLLCLEVLQTLCDLGLAIFWMPAGFLWGGQLPSTIWGMLGTVSSIIGLYRMITNQ